MHSLRNDSFQVHIPGELEKKFPVRIEVIDVEEPLAEAWHYRSESLLPRALLNFLVHRAVNYQTRAYCIHLRLDGPGIGLDSHVCLHLQRVPGRS